MRALFLALCLAAGTVSAKPVALTRTTTGTIVLDDERAGCPEGSKAVLFLSQGGNVPGCWFVAHGRVWMFFDDGDSGSAPLSAFKWRES